MLHSIKNHEDYLDAMDELYILMDTPPAGLDKAQSERLTWLMDIVKAWESKFDDSSAPSFDLLNY